MQDTGEAFGMCMIQVYQTDMVLGILHIRSRQQVLSPKRGKSRVRREATVPLDASEGVSHQ